MGGGENGGQIRTPRIFLHITTYQPSCQFSDIEPVRIQAGRQISKYISPKDNHSLELGFVRCELLIWMHVRGRVLICDRKKTGWTDYSNIVAISVYPPANLL